jgi:hypothetical protein
MHTTVLQSELEQLKKKHRVPALAAAVQIDGEVREFAAIGKRKIGDRLNK